MKTLPITNHLVDQYQTHLKFNGRTPSTLYEHRRRLAEVKALGAKLAQLDAFLPALAERGIRLCYRDLSTWDGGKTLRIQPPALELDNKLCDALLALGFKEVERKDSFRDEQTVTLKHGRALLVSLGVKKAAAAPTGTPS